MFNIKSLWTWIGPQDKEIVGSNLGAVGTLWIGINVTQSLVNEIVYLKLQYSKKDPVILSSMVCSSQSSSVNSIQSLVALTDALSCPTNQIERLLAGQTTR